MTRAAAHRPKGRFAGLGNALEALRRRHKLQVKTLAEKVGVTPAMVSRWESGEATPSLDNLGRLGDVLGLHFGDLDDMVCLANGLPPRPRRPAPPRSAAEIAFLVATLAGTPPAAGEEPELHSALRRLTADVLRELAAAAGVPRD